LPNQQLARPVQHQVGLLLCAFDLNKPHRRPGDRFTDCLGVDRVVLAPLDVGFDITCRHQPNVMAERGQLAAPMMSATAGLHADQAG
jgi:hypothetical protein